MSTGAQPDEAWRPIIWREGKWSPQQTVRGLARSWRHGGCARHSETHGRTWTGPEGWLIGERPLQGEEGDPKWFFSWLPASTSLERLVMLAHMRWPIEQFYEDAKGECGLDNYQGRRWDGLHRHVALVMLAYTFLMIQSQVSPEPSTEGFFPSVRQISLPTCHRQVLIWLF